MQNQGDIEQNSKKKKKKKKLESIKVKDTKTNS